MGAGYTDTVCLGNTVLAIPPIFVPAHSMPVGYLDQLADLRKRKGLSQAGLAELLGVEQPTVQRWEKGKREPSLGQLIEIAKVLDIEPGSLIDPTMVVPIGPRLFVKGEVAAGVWRQAFEWPQDDWQSFTGRSDVKAEIAHRFGLRVVGDSMNEVYPEGTIVECVSVFGHAEPEPGRRVVVLRTNENDEVEATVKELVEQDGELWLVPRSTNPAHRPFKASEPESGIKQVRIAAIVVASVRPE
jgi:transcriptional regulator with XRE-family HTH domain